MRNELLPPWPPRPQILPTGTRGILGAEAVGEVRLMAGGFGDTYVGDWRTDDDGVTLLGFVYADDIDWAALREIGGFQFTD